MKIVTLTLNPAFDIHCRLSHFAAGHENFAKERTCDVGGKGINIARALQTNGVDCTAYVLLGRENSSEFEKGLQKEGVNYCALYTDGRIRENLTLYPAGERETRISFDGFASDANCLSVFEEMLGNALDGTFFCLTGSIAEGMDKEEVKAFLLRLRAKGAKIVLDSRSFSREDVLQIRPFLIKPNLDELQSYTDCPPESEEEIAACALKLHRAGIDCVMVSMGAEGALLAADGICLRASAPNVDARSTVGAGDSMIAGYLSALSNGAGFSECLSLAVAFGSAACLRPGTQPPTAGDIAALQGKISVFRLDGTHSISFLDRNGGIS